MSRISVVINTLNEEKNLPRALKSLKGLADEIVVVDMHSDDKTRQIAKKAGAKVFLHKKTGYVEPARNFALRQAQGDWIFILDADEEVSPDLVRKLKSIATARNGADFYRVPRLNIIFGKIIRHSRWWPDYNIRFFKKGAVRWSEVIHSVPETHGKGLDLPPQEKYTIIHHNYNSVSQYLERMFRYTDIQAKFLVNEGYKFSWKDIINKPTSEFVSRFFASQGYKDGVHGLVLGLLQAFSEALVIIKVWESENFRDADVKEKDLSGELVHVGYETNHWLVQTGLRSRSLVRRILDKIFS